MPWSPKQHRLFEAAANDPEVAERRGLSREKAQKLADEGVRKSDEPAAKSNFLDISAAFR